MAFKVYTRTGDRGDTGLFGGGRVGKDDVRVDAYGEVDELNAVVGLVRAADAGLPADDAALRTLDDVLAGVQRDLFAIGALLATPDREKMRAQLDKARLDAPRIAELEAAIDAADEVLASLKTFILPGGTPKAAALHVARTVCRRAERRVVHLGRETDVPDEIVVYLNRLSDLLFTLARLANHAAGVPDTAW